MTGILTKTLLIGLALTAQTSTSSPPPEAEIRQAVEQLGSSVFAQRQEASTFLWKAGHEAEPALRRALSDRDPEVAFRARTILEQFRYGIYPDTPAKIVAIIENFRGGDLIVKRTALKQLRDLGEIRTLLSLLKLEDSEKLRTQLTREFSSDFSGVTTDLLVQGKIDDAEAWLELAAATSEQARRNLTALHLMTGRIEPRIQSLRKAVREGENEDAWQQLFYDLRAAGKSDEALEVLQEVGPRAEQLREGLLFEQRDWRRLAEIYDKERKENESLAGSIEYLGYAAAYHRLSGDTDAFESDVESIVRLAGDDNQRWNCAEALMINGRFEQGIEALQGDALEAPFRLLAAQLRYHEAFQLVGLPEVGNDPRPWFEQVARDIQTDDKDLRARFNLALAAARALYRVGDREHALAAFALLGRSLAGDDNGERLENLCEAERKLGLIDQAFEHGALALAKGPEGSALAALFPEQTDEANVWWRFFRERHAGESHRASLDRVGSILGVDSEDGGEASRKLLDQAQREAKSLDKDRRVQWHRALAETALRRGDRARALELLEDVAEVSAEAALRLADLQVADEHWVMAARWYDQASKDSESQALATYLRGYCLDQAGDKAQGAELMKLAQLLPLADGSQRRDLAEGLKDRGLSAEARRQWELILRTTGLRDWYYSNAAMNLGNLLSGKDHLAAADNWESLSLSVLKSSSSFVKVEGYLQLPHLVHKSRARGLLAEGKNKQAVENLWISHAAFPGNIDLAEDLIPELEAAGLQTTADELFNKVYVLNERLCTDFPDNASTHNNLAWLAARNGRRLEEALHHARRAVELAPDTAAYLDTLAEALYRTGGREEAVKLERRCLEQEPNNEHYQKQLARFEKG